MVPVRALVIAVLCCATVSVGGRVGQERGRPFAGPPPPSTSLKTVKHPGRRLGQAPPSYGSYAWPVVGPVIRGFEEPDGPYGRGHRGIDIAVPFGTPLKASGDGVVAFAGWINGSQYISIDHPDGVRTTYSFLSAILVKKGDAVSRGQVIGATGHGHPYIPTPHLHFGARVGSVYIDPMLLLEGRGVVGLVRLAPLPQ